MKKIFKKFVVFVTAAALLISLGILVSAAEPESDDLKIILDGELISFGGVQPFIENGRTFVPCGDMLKAFGLYVNYSEHSREMSASFETSKNSIRLKIISDENIIAFKAIEYEPYNKTKEIGIVEYEAYINCKITDGVLFVPVRTISDMMGCKISWDSKTKTITITPDNAVITGIQKENGEIPAEVKLDLSGIAKAKAARLRAMEDEVAESVNKLRAKKGLSTLSRTDALNVIARTLAQEIVDTRKIDLSSSKLRKLLEEASIEPLIFISEYATSELSADDIAKQWGQNASSDKITDIGIGSARLTNGVIYYVHISVKPFCEEDGKAFEDEIIVLVNKERVKRGLHALSPNKDLASTAKMKAQNMVDKGYFSHKSPTYGTPKEMVNKYAPNVTFCGENLAYGQKTPQKVVSDWMNSPSHSASLFSENPDCTGVGVVMDKNGNMYWALLTGIK